MTSTRRLILASTLVLVAALAQRGVAQTAPVPANGDVISTAAGVYTPAQAARGEETYMNACVGCHPAGTYATSAFREKWDGRPLSELYLLVSETMPKQEPASLSGTEYTQVVAYLLKINDAPAGQAELASDVERMKKIRIEMPTAKPKKD